jgi:hypothetical protein
LELTASMVLSTTWISVASDLVGFAPPPADSRIGHWKKHLKPLVANGPTGPLGVSCRASSPMTAILVLKVWSWASCFWWDTQPASQSCHGKALIYYIFRLYSYVLSGFFA